MLRSLSLLAGLGTAFLTLSLRASPQRHFSENRNYNHALFASQQECDEARKKFPGINCYQWVSFTPDGTATLVVTDIMNLGTYEISGDKVLLTMSTPGEVPTQVSFSFAPDQDTLRLDADGTLWKLRKEDLSEAGASGDVLECNAKDATKKLHVKVFPFVEHGKKCGDNLQFYLNDQKLDRKWLCENGTFSDTFSEVYSRPEGDTVLFYDPQQGYELGRFPYDAAGIFPLDCKWGSR